VEKWQSRIAEECYKKFLDPYPEADDCRNSSSSFLSIVTLCCLYLTTLSPLSRYQLSRES